MNPKPLLGIVLHWIGGFAVASTFYSISPHSWLGVGGLYWLVQGVAE